MSKRRFGALWQATRPYSFTATLVPVLIGTAGAKVEFPALAIAWGHFLMVLVGALAIHILSNVLNDVYDARSGLDNPNNFGRFNAVVAGLVTTRDMFGIALVAGAVSLGIGLYFVLVVGTPVLGLMALGAFLAVFYTMPPIRLKHHVLGDVSVLLGFGLGMAFGAYVVQAHSRSGDLDGRHLLAIFAYAFPTALPMVGILHANNHRDRLNDREYGARTLANVLRPETSKRVMVALLVAPLVLFVAAVLAGLTTAWVLVTILSLPPLLKILAEVREDRFEGMLVPQVAQFHGMFGLLTTIGMVVAAWRR